MRRLVLLVALAGCTPHLTELSERDFRVDGARRTYELYVPASAPRPAPLVVALHRLLESGSVMATLTGFNKVADREGFVVVYPNGPWRRFEAFESDSRDDVALVLAVIEDVARQVPVDRRRIYVTGASNGGFLTHRMACLKPRVFAAAAPVMALMPGQLAERVPDGEPVPMLIIHGTRDGIVPEDDTSVFAGKKYDVLPMEETIDYWVRRNRALTQATMRELPDRDPKDGTRVEVRRHAAQQGGAEVVYYRVLGGGHTWPGGVEPTPAFIVGTKSKEFSASEVIWEFFRRYRRP
ncbi:MAG: extracellular catalytic domain type 1 short-chain-length polyhydroxyalkanoate depolymerase [Planctomycetota bacterium]